MANAALTVPSLPELYANVKDTFPKKQTLSGNVSSAGVFVTGSGTLFTTEIKSAVGIQYGYLVSVANLECRKIIEINSDTSLTIESAFTSGLANETFYWCPNFRFMLITAQEHNSQTWKLNGKLMGAGVPVSFSKDNFVERDIAPFFVDTTTNGNTVDIVWQT